MTGKQLKNSILQWAIQGRLVPQDPNDEPASVLLERIRAEKARLVKEGKIKKDKNESIIFRGDDNSHYEKFLATGEVKCIDDEIPFEIPKGWEWARLSQIVYNHGQKAPDEVFSYIDIGSIDNVNQKLNYKETILNANEAPSRARRIIRFGDIIYSTVRPYLHNTCIIDRTFLKPAIASTGFAVFACHRGLINKYLFNYLLTPQFDAYANDKNNAKGVAYPAINDEKLYKALVPVPPTNEQNRIINIIEQLSPYVSRYSEAASVLKSLNTQLGESLKRSILQQAIQGKLVSQTAEDGTAQELLEQIKNEKQKLVKEGKLKKADSATSNIFKGDDNKYYEQVGDVINDISEEIAFDIPENWRWCRLKDLCRIITGATFKKEESSQNGKGIRVLRGGNILPFRVICKSDDLFLDKSRVKPEIILRKNDLITPAVTSLENICKMARISEDMESTTVGGFVFILRPYSSNSIFSIYLLEALCSPTLVEHIKSITNKSGQAFYNIGKERLATVLIPLPPIAEQQKINTIIGELFQKLT